MGNRIAFAAASLLASAVAFGFGSVIARGQATTIKILSGSAVAVVGNTAYHLDTANQPVGWHLMPDGNFDLPPIPPSTLAYYSSGIVAITDSGEGWGKVGGVWTDLGPVPGSVPTTRESWGQLKAKYAR
jgi:hypothetical protein